MANTARKILGSSLCTGRDSHFHRLMKFLYACVTARQINASSTKNISLRVVMLPDES